MNVQAYLCDYVNMCACECLCVSKFVRMLVQVNMCLLMRVSLCVWICAFCEGVCVTEWICEHLSVCQHICVLTTSEYFNIWGHVIVQVLLEIWLCANYLRVPVCVSKFGSMFVHVSEGVSMWVCDHVKIKCAPIGEWMSVLLYVRESVGDCAQEHIWQWVIEHCHLCEQASLSICGSVNLWACVWVNTCV